MAWEDHGHIGLAFAFACDVRGRQSPEDPKLGPWLMMHDTSCIGGLGSLVYICVAYSITSIDNLHKFALVCAGEVPLIYVCKLVKFPNGRWYIFFYYLIYIYRVHVVKLLYLKQCKETYCILLPLSSSYLNFWEVKGCCKNDSCLSVFVMFQDVVFCFIWHSNFSVYSCSTNISWSKGYLK